jgi:hypothetical protein
MSNRDKTPVGLVVVNAIEGPKPIGETSDGKALTASAVEGTWRADEDSLSVTSESAEKPLMVIYEDGTPIHAEVITMSDYLGPLTPDTAPAECYDDDGNIYLPENSPQECMDKMIEIQNALMEKWRTFAKDAGATKESIDANFPLEETTVAEAESIFGPVMSLQSHFVW